MAWIKLTQPQGDPVWINTALVEKLSVTKDGGGCAVCVVSGHLQIVQESPRKVLDLIRGEKGDEA